MVKKFWLMVLAIGFLASVSGNMGLAEEGAQRSGSLNVVSGNGTLEVQLDGSFIGFTPLKLVHIQAGSHHFIARSAGEVVEEDVIEIREGELTTILVSSEKDEKEPKKVEEKKSEVTPKNFSVGYDISWPFYGLSLIYHPGQHGVGINYYQSQNYYGYDLTHISLRYYYYLQPGMYLSAGLGQYSDTREIYTYTYSDGWYYDYEYSTIKYTETLLGVQFGGKVSDYTKYEIGYGLRSTSLGKTDGMVMLGMGIMFDF